MVSQTYTVYWSDLLYIAQTLFDCFLLIMTLNIWRQLSVLNVAHSKDYIIFMQIQFNTVTILLMTVQIGG